MADDRQVVVRGSGDGYRQTIQAGRHALLADEPVAAGGADAGPTPYGFLLAALGSCTSITVQMYARRKGWPLRSVQVSLRHEKIHAEDCANCETKTGKIDRIDVRLSVDGDLSAEQRARLLEIAGKCPVHRTLKEEKEIRLALDP